MEADDMTAEFINNEIQGLQYHTFVVYTNLVLSRYSHVEDEEPETNVDTNSEVEY
jgi:hypothetical protein